MGRPTKLTPETQDTICQALAAGTPLKYAAVYAGVGISTVHNWVARADGDGGIYAEFRDAIRRAQARSVTRLVAQIATAAQGGDWRAAAWLLERRAPEEFVAPEKRADLDASRAKAEVTRAEADGKLRYLDRRRAREAGSGG